MKLYKPKSIEDYMEMVVYLIESDQPTYVYRSDDETILISDVEIDDIEGKIAELADELKETKSPDEIIVDGWTQDDLDELGDYFLGI